jgi:sulfur carrier protein ThiS
MKKPAVEMFRQLNEGGVTGVASVLDGSNYAQPSKPPSMPNVAGDVIKNIINRMKTRSQMSKDKASTDMKAGLHHQKLRHNEELHKLKLLQKKQEVGHDVVDHEQDVRHKEDVHKEKLKTIGVKESMSVKRLQKINELLAQDKGSDQKRVTDRKNVPSDEVAVKNNGNAVPTRDLGDAVVHNAAKHLSDIDWQNPFRK